MIAAVVAHECDVTNDVMWHVPHHYKKIFRDIEKATKKCVHLNGAIKFNKTCLTNRIFPKYCYIIIIIIKKGRECKAERE